MPSWVGIFLVYLIGMNLSMYFLMWEDKRRARKQKWRIEEKRLWIIAALGGAIGGWLAMRLLRHKNQNKAFAVGLPGLAIVYLGILLLIDTVF
ncbi:DUF1294 domain-containing protein [Halobacillus fulvus]|nr:DUF1294 domain-containing protein [Halobacillus fulvus]